MHAFAGDHALDYKAILFAAILLFFYQIRNLTASQVVQRIIRVGLGSN